MESITGSLLDSLTPNNQIKELKSETKKMRFFATDFKLEVIEFAKQNSANSASHKYGVDRHSIRQWVRKEDKLRGMQEMKAAGHAIKRLPGAGRPILYKELDTELAIWVQERRSSNSPISRRIIQQQAEMMFGEKCPSFKASGGWLEKFLNRHKFRLSETPPVLQPCIDADVLRFFDSRIFAPKLEVELESEHSEVPAISNTLSDIFKTDVNLNLGIPDSFNQQTPSSSSLSLKRNSYSIETKLEAVEHAKKFSKHAASAKFNVTRSTIQYWMKQEQELREFLYTPTSSMPSSFCGFTSPRGEESGHVNPMSFVGAAIDLNLTAPTLRTQSPEYRQEEPPMLEKADVISEPYIMSPGEALAKETLKAVNDLSEAEKTIFFQTFFTDCMPV